MAYKNKKDQYACQKRWYERHKIRHRANVRRNERERISKNFDAINALKAESGCIDCRKHYAPYILDFDHVRGAKMGNIGNSMWKSLEWLLGEISKCDIVCSNCHRERTYRRLPNKRNPG